VVGKKENKQCTSPARRRAQKRRRKACPERDRAPKGGRCSRYSANRGFLGRLKVVEVTHDRDPGARERKKQLIVRKRGDRREKGVTSTTAKTSLEGSGRLGKRTPPGSSSGRAIDHRKKGKSDARPRRARGDLFCFLPERDRISRRGGKIGGDHKIYLQRGKKIPHFVVLDEGKSHSDFLQYGEKVTILKEGRKENHGQAGFRARWMEGEKKKSPPSLPEWHSGCISTFSFEGGHQAWRNGRPRPLS